MKDSTYIISIPEIEYQILFILPIPEFIKLLFVNKYYYHIVTDSEIYRYLKKFIIKKCNGKSLKNMYRIALDMKETMVIEYLYEKHEIYDITTIFIDASLNGNLKIARWALNRMIDNNTHFDFRDIDENYWKLIYAFIGACRNNCIDIAMWLYNIFSQDIYDDCVMYIEDIFCFVCGRGFFEMARWIYEEFKNKIDIQAMNSLAFVNACRNGHLEIAKWLFKICKINKREIDIHLLNTKKNLLTKISKRGKCRVFKWLLEIATNETDKMLDFHYGNEKAFRKACMADKMKMAKLLYNHSLEMNSPIDIHAKDEYSFRRACANGNYDMAKWLYELGIQNNSPINISAKNNQAFIKACISGNLRLVKWIYNVYETTASKINLGELNNKILIHPWKSGNIEVVEWLYFMMKKTVNSKSLYDNIGYLTLRIYKKNMPGIYENCW